MVHEKLKLPKPTLRAPSSTIKGGDGGPIKGLIEATLGLAVFTALVPLLQR